MSSGYRADIDGLRTVAVVPVVLFHAGLPFLGGGYVGVDIFFVISGFLITGLLQQSIAAGRFSLAQFYGRRIRRIFPALLLVVAITTLVAWLVLMPARLVDYGESLAAMSVFASNLHFWKAVDYFANAAHVLPLLHTWSLAVEEQFYIFYPPILWFVATRRLPLKPILIAATVASLVLSVVLIARMPGTTF